MAQIRFLRVTWLSFLPLAAAAACGGSSSGGGESTPLADAPTKLASAFCDVFDQCLGEAAAFSPLGQDCAGSLTKQIEQSDFSLLQGRIDAGTVQYDGTKVSGCADAIRSAGCTVFSNRLSTLCPGVLTGTVDPGGACVLSGECKTGSFCRTDQACPGTCTALRSAGQDCVKSDDCQDTLICSDRTKKCVKPSGSGDPCEGSSGPPCTTGLVCKGASGTTPGTCISPSAAFGAASGAACDPTSGTFCQQGLGCALIGVTAAGAQFQCEAPTSGGACHVAYPEACPSDQYCELPGSSVDGTCKPLPGDGQPCAKHVPSDPNSTDTLCATGAVCVQGTCHTMKNLGESCSIDDECYSTACDAGGCAPSKCAAM